MRIGWKKLSVVAALVFAAATLPMQACSSSESSSDEKGGDESAEGREESKDAPGSSEATGTTASRAAPSAKASERCSLYKRCTGYGDVTGCRKSMKDCLPAVEGGGFPDACMKKLDELVASGPVKVADYCVGLCAVCE